MVQQLRSTRRRLGSSAVSADLVAAIGLAGVVGGAFGAGYLWLLDRTTELIGPGRWSGVTRLMALALVGGVVAVLVRLLGRPADVELLVDNIHVPDAEHDVPARLRSLLPVSLLCIGAGGTLGPEAPVVTATGSIAHRMGRHRFDHAEARVVTLTGMAAGFAVLFGAPLGGAIFALEIPHRRGMQYYEAVVPAAAGAVIGFAVSTLLGRHGLAPVWSLPFVDRLRVADLGWSVVAGLAGALVAIGFTATTKALLWGVGRVDASARPVVGGLVLGSLALLTPYALTNGEWQLDSLARNVAVATLLVAAAAKLVAAAVAVATGWRGGFIIPLFFVGFCVGRALTDALPTATPWAFVIGVMVAANVGVTKTPLGSTLVVTQMAGMAVLPSTLIAALTCLVVTSPVGLIAAQRERVDVYRGAHDPASP